MAAPNSSIASSLCSIPLADLLEQGTRALSTDPKLAYRLLAEANHIQQRATVDAHRRDPSSNAAPIGTDALQCALSLIASGVWLEDATWREAWSRDARRDPSQVCIYAMSDVHIDQGQNRAWIEGIHPTRYQDAILILAGDLGDSIDAVALGLKILRPKFRRVFFAVGNHDLYLRDSRGALAVGPDSISKLLALTDLFAALDVDYRPAEVARGVFVAPLFSWYEEGFAVEDPAPGRLRFDKFCVFPFREEHVASFMIGLNRWIASAGSLKRDRARDVVITATHFLPRTELPSSPWVPELRKNVGSVRIEEMLDALDSDLHVFGHSHMNGRWELERGPGRRRTIAKESGGHGVRGPEGDQHEESSGASPSSSDSDDRALERKTRVYVQNATHDAGQGMAGRGRGAQLCCVFEGGKAAYRMETAT